MSPAATQCNNKIYKTPRHGEIVFDSFHSKRARDLYEKIKFNVQMCLARVNGSRKTNESDIESECKNKQYSHKSCKSSHYKQCVCIYEVKIWVLCIRTDTSEYYQDEHLPLPRDNLNTALDW